MELGPVDGIPLATRGGTPRDEFNLAYCIFFLQGIGQLLPWNVFINAADYFSRRLCGTPFERNFENCFSMGYNLTGVFGLCLALRYQHRFGQRLRVVGSLMVTTTVFFVSMILVLCIGVSGTSLFFTTMVLVCLSALSVAFLQGALFAFAASFPAKFTQAMMAGQGFAGLVVSLSGYFTTLSRPDSMRDCSLDAEWQITAAGITVIAAEQEALVPARCVPYVVDLSTAVYFSIACGTLMVCVLAYPVLERLPISVHFRASCSDDTVDKGPSLITQEGGASSLAPLVPEEREGEQAAEEEGNEALEALVSSGMSSDSLPIPPLPLNTNTDLGSSGVVGDVSVEVGNPTLNGKFHGDGGAGSSGGSGGGGSVHSYSISNLQGMLPFAGSVFFVFTVTLSIFPGLTSRIGSSRQCDPGRPRFFAEDLFVMFSFLSFNLFDFGGRILAGLPGQPLPSGSLPLAAAARIVFVPLALLCRVEGSRLPHALGADLFPLVLMPLLALSNGYVSSLSMMTGPRVVPIRVQGAAGTAMVLAMTLGLLCGSACSFVVLYVSTGALS
ncbi:unnamed protein product [Discosporangium mesarthrocarpum]